MSYRKSTVTTSSAIKEKRASSENVGKTGVAAAAAAKKRPPLANLTNQKLGFGQNGSRSTALLLPLVEEFCCITDNTYSREEVLQMESSVLNFLKFEMTTPTVKCFLRRFIRAAQGINEDSTLAQYTQYQASELHDCVNALHHLCRDNPSSSLPAIREKYSQNKPLIHGAELI